MKGLMLEGLLFASKIGSHIQDWRISSQDTFLWGFCLLVILCNESFFFPLFSCGDSFSFKHHVVCLLEGCHHCPCTDVAIYKKTVAVSTVLCIVLLVRRVSRCLTQSGTWVSLHRKGASSSHRHRGQVVAWVSFYRAS